MGIGHWEMLVRIAAAAILGGVIGLERDIHRRQAGFRTHLIVSMASATFMVVSAHFLWFQHYVPGHLVVVDTSRIAAAVVTGVGFLGGGSILRTGATVQGLTTAAALWLVAAIGMCCGSGMYPEAGFATLLGLLSLTLLRFLDDKHRMRRKVSITFSVTANPVALLKRDVEALGAKILDIDYHNDLVSSRTSLSFDVLIPETLGLQKLIDGLEQLRGLQEIHVRVP
ncbi:MAG TPA: MgtC/SapB family protein [Anaeromyxobacteraceae bacterium]|nr:MgtC/SapB family protein [Anaeromyxobacteraceae bacterium]